MTARMGSPVVNFVVTPRLALAVVDVVLVGVAALVVIIVVVFRSPRRRRLRRPKTLRPWASSAASASAPGSSWLRAAPSLPPADLPPPRPRAASVPQVAAKRLVYSLAPASAPASKSGLGVPLRASICKGLRPQSLGRYVPGSPVPRLDVRQGAPPRLCAEGEAQRGVAEEAAEARGEAGGLGLRRDHHVRQLDALPVHGLGDALLAGPRLRRRIAVLLVHATSFQPRPAPDRPLDLGVPGGQYSQYYQQGSSVVAASEQRSRSTVVRVLAAS